MKRWYYLALGAAAVAAGGYLYVHGGLVPGGLFSFVGGTTLARSTGGEWRTIHRPEDGFTVDLPGETRDTQAPAYNENGGTEPVHMLVANSGGDISYAVTWQDNPPVARVSPSADRTLYMARDGMLARTATTIISESASFHRDYPSLDVLARNNNGGILNARLVLADDRLYMLIALFPSDSDRREGDVHRFFDSFVPARRGRIPETVPEASQE